MNGSKQNQEGIRRGFIAQNVEKVDDYYISKSLMSEDNREYEYVKDDPNVYASKLGGKDAMYVSAMKSLLKRIEALENA